MKKFGAIFSYYSEEYGNFDTIRFEVEAADQFDARIKAWEAFDRSEDEFFASCVKLCGVVWEASPLDIQDYFNSLAAQDKCRIKEIENAVFPNDEIRCETEKRENPEKRTDESRARHENERSCCYGSLYAAACIARDCYKPLGIIPPDAYVEIHYAKEFVDWFDRKGMYEQAAALLERVEAAERWDNDAIFSLKETFRSHYVRLDGEDYNLSEQFGRNGIYPEHTDICEFAHSYVYRWRNARYIEQLSRLRHFDGRDVINGSASIPFEYKTLVLRRECLKDGFQSPENLLWTPRDREQCVDSAPDSRFYAENMITGETTEWRRCDFYGVLRPELNDNISFDALKQEYATDHANKRVANEAEGEEVQNFDDEAEPDEDENDWDYEM